MSSIRRWLLAVLCLGLIGSLIELLLIAHYEDKWQMVPIALIALSTVLIGWYAIHPSPAVTLLIRSTMGLLLLAGAVGVGLHMSGAAEFQREIDSDIGGWALFTKVIRAKAPPALAPGLLVQLGLIGLIVTFTKEERS